MSNENKIQALSSGAILGTIISISTMLGNVGLFYLMNSLNHYDRYKNITSMTSGSWIVFIGMILLSIIGVKAYARNDSPVTHLAAFILLLVSVPYILLYSLFTLSSPGIVSIINICAIGVVNAVYLFDHVQDFINR